MMFNTPAINSRIATKAARPIPLSMASALSLDLEGPHAPRRQSHGQAMGALMTRHHPMQVIRPVPCPGTDSGLHGASWSQEAVRFVGRVFGWRRLFKPRSVR